MSLFSQRVKSYRHQLNFSMQELADRADLSKSMICKIENNGVQPTLDVATRIAQALGTTLSELVEERQKQRLIHIPQGQQTLIEDPATGMCRYSISPVFEGLELEWLLVQLPGKEKIGPFYPLGRGSEKYFYVTRGKLIVTLEDKIVTLKKGDSLYFDATQTQYYTNPNTTTAEFYVVIDYASSNYGEI